MGAYLCCVSVLTTSHNSHCEEVRFKKSDIVKTKVN